MPLIKSLVTTLICAALAAGCSRKDPAVVVASRANAEAPETDPQIMELRPLAQLAPDRPTHLAADSVANVYWVQETADGQDTLFVAGSDDIPQPTQLTTSAIIAAFGPSVSAGAASQTPTTTPTLAAGNIQSITTDPDDHLVFFFNGGTGRTDCVGLGQFDPRRQSIQIFAGTRALAAQAGMGASIALAQGQIIKPATSSATVSARYWLWLHHSDVAIVLRFDLHSQEPGQPIDLFRSFDQLVGAGAPARLTDDQLAFAAGEDDSLSMIDWRTAWLFHISDIGAVTPWMSVLGIPRDLSELTQRPGGIELAFAPAGEPAAGTEADGQSLKKTSFLELRYPALIAITNDTVIPVVKEEDMRGPPEIDIAKLRLQQFLPTGRPHEWIGYDAQSGMLLRIQLTPKTG
jgi:hypothetical protein